MATPNPSVDGYIRKNKRWQAELQKIREIILGSELVEEIKWRVPCYTLEGKNVLFLGALKESCGVSFIKGVLMKDPRGLLVSPGQDSQSVRVIRFTSMKEIESQASALGAYVQAAIEVERSGRKVQLKKIEDRPVPQELLEKFKQMPALHKAFAALTPGRRRAYLIHIASAKQSATRAARVEKHVQRILKGLGMDD